MQLPTYQSLIASKFAAEGFTKFSTSAIKDDAVTAKVATTWQKLDLAQRILCTMHSTHHQVLTFDENGKLQVLTKPTPGSIGPTNTSCILASRSDDFDLPVPIYIAGSDTFGSTLIGLAPKAIALKFRWPTSPTCPVSTTGPDPAEPPSADRVHMPYTDDDQKPVLVEIPKVVPVPPGFFFPVGIDIGLVHDIDDLTDYQQLAEWYKVCKHLHDFATTKSLTSPNNTLFLPADIDTSKFSQAGTIPCSLGVEMHHLAIDSSSAKDVVEIIRNLKHHLAYTYVANDPAPTTPTRPALPSRIADPNSVSPTSLVDAFIQATGKSRSTTDKEKDQDKEESIAFYRLLFGRTVTTVDLISNTSTTEFIPADLQKKFTDILGTSKGSRAAGKLQQMMTDFQMSIASSDKAIDIDCNFNTAVFDAFFATQIQQCRFATKSIVINEDAPATEIGIHHFGPVNQQSHEYKEVQRGNLKILHQEQVGEDKSKISNRRTSLFTNIDLDSFSSIVKMLSTFIGFVRMVTVYDEKNPPDMIDGLLNGLRALRSEEAQVFERNHCKSPGICFNVAQDFQNMTLGFVNASHKSPYRQAILEKQPLPPSIMSKAKRVQNIYLNNMVQIFNSGIMQAYLNVPKTYTTIFYGKTGTSDRKPAESPKVKTPTKNDRQPPTQPPARDNQQQQNRRGILKFTGEGKPPIPDMSFPHPTNPNQKSPMCMNSALKNKECRFGTRCRLFHASKPSEIPANLRAPMQAWVTATPGMEWAQRMNYTQPPASATPVDSNQPSPESAGNTQG